MGDRRGTFLRLVRSRPVIALFASALGFFLVGTVVLAKIPDPDGTIHGCRNKKTGALRVIDPATQTCAPGERSLAWNQRGPRGKQGPQGLPGASAVHREGPADNTITTIDTSEGAGSSTMTTIGADGLPLVAYLAGPIDQDDHPIDPRELKVAHCDDVECTSATIRSLATDAGQADQGVFGKGALGLTIGIDGLPLITYYKKTTGDLVAVHCNDASCGAATISPVGTAGDVGRDSSVTIAPAILPAPDAPDGTATIPPGPVISYYDATNGDLKVARCNDAACAGGDETIKTVDSTGDVGRFTSIATSIDGTPIVAYQAITADELRVAYCGPPFVDVPAHCDSPTIKTLDSGLTTGNSLFTSIVIGADGLPLIAYDKGFAHCSDMKCTTSALSQPTGFGQSPLPQSVTVGTDGFPIYVGDVALGPTHQGLAHCVDMGCATITYGFVTETNWRSPSVTVGSDGLPLIAFQRGLIVPAGPGNVLSVAHCSNVFCTSMFRRL